MSEIKKAEPAVRVAKETPVVHSTPKKVEDKPFDVHGALVNLHRGIYPDVKKMSPENKSALLKLVNEETKTETTFKYPAKEQARERLRKQLA